MRTFITQKASYKEKYLDFIVTENDMIQDLDLDFFLKEKIDAHLMSKNHNQ